MPALMVQFQHAGGSLSLADAAALLDVPIAALDSSFGVIATDPSEKLYTVLIAQSSVRHALEAIRRKGAIHLAEGIYGNPRVQPTGPDPDAD